MFMKNQLTNIQKFLFFLIIFIVLLTSICTICVFCSKTKNTENYNSQPPSSKDSSISSLDTSLSTEAMFKALGQIRGITAEPNGVPFVIEVYFSFDPQDFDFYEELMQKRNNLQMIIKEYFSKNTKDFFIQKGESFVKAELLKEFNNSLVLGKIQKLFFSEYIFLE